MTSELIAALPRGTLMAAASYGLVAVVFAVAERLWHGLAVRRYLRPAVINDYLYCIFFNGGYFTLLAYPFVKAVELLLAPLRLDLLPTLPMTGAASYSSPKYRWGPA